MIVISCNKVSKSYVGKTILNNVSFSINSGEKIALIGDNGAGKTTLFKLLTDQIPMDSGNIHISKDYNIGYMKQEEFDLDQSVLEYCRLAFLELVEFESALTEFEDKLNHHKDKSSSEYVHLINTHMKMLEEFESKGGYLYKSQIRGVLNGLGFTDGEFDKKISTLSGGQLSRLRLAKLLIKAPNILLLDEPTNHLDLDATIWLETYLKQYNGTLLIISHDRYFLNQIINRVIEIENLSIMDYKGDYDEFKKLKSEHIKSEMRKYQKQQKEIEKQEELIRKFKERGTEKLAKRARSREKRLEHVEVYENPFINKSRISLNFKSSSDSGNDVLVATDLSKSYGEKTIFKDASFSIYKREKIGLIGSNGIGKTTLFKIILNLLDSTTGEVSIGHNVNMGYFDQTQLNLNQKNNLVEEIHDAFPDFTETKIRGLLGAFLFREDDVFKSIESLSGGEKSKVSLLKLILRQSNFLLLDEPTNHLDIKSKEVLEESLMNYDGTILAISHDRYFLDNVCDKIFEMTADGIKVYHGNYSYYFEKRLDFLEEKQNSLNNSPSEQKNIRQKEKDRQRDIKRLEKSIMTLESEIHSVEEDLLQLEEDLCKPEIYNDGIRANEVKSEIENLKSYIESHYIDWERMHEELNSIKGDI